jgi:hypothetical protein
MPGTNIQFPTVVRLLFRYVPIVLTILRWLVFWFLESGLGQFYDTDKGLKARKEALKSSQDYVRNSAPGEPDEISCVHGTLLTKNSKISRSFDAQIRVGLQGVYPQRDKSPLLPHVRLMVSQRRILDMKYMKTLHNKKMVLTKDSVVDIHPDCVITASGEKYETDFIVSSYLPPFVCPQLSNPAGRSWQLDSKLRNGPSMSSAVAA